MKQNPKPKSPLVFCLSLFCVRLFVKGIDDDDCVSSRAMTTSPTTKKTKEEEEEDLFEIDAINLEITRCELALVRREDVSGGKQRLPEKKKKKKRWTSPNATVYRKPRERRERENAIVDEKTFPDATPAWTEKKTTTTTTRPREIFGATQQTKRDAVKKATNRHSLEQILQKADEETRSTCTFQPKTIAKGYLEEDSERRKARRERLLQSRLDIVREREAAKREAEKATLEKECTFRPKILALKKGSKKEEEEEEEEGTNVKSVSERLHVEAQVREERLRERREHEEKKIQKELRHASTKRATSSYGAPMHERLKGISEKRERVMREAAKKVEEAFREAHTFKPKKMRSTSEKLAALANRRKKENDDSMKCVKTTTSVNDEDKDGSENIKSFPKITISANSEKIMRKNIQNGKIGEGFLERQYEFASRIRAKRANRNALHVQVFENECTFSPDIHSSSEKHYYETQSERSRRLAITEVQDMHERAESMRRERDEQFTFIPKINDKSNVIANATNLDELASSKSNDLEREAAKQLHEMETLKECTFSPHVNQKIDDADFLLAVSKKSGSYGKYDVDTITYRVKSEKEMREYNLERARRERVFEERKTCTFSPQIKSDIGISNPHVPAEEIVKGIDKYYDNVEKATKMKAEKESRRQKVFLENVSQIDVRHKITKPKEFNFARNQAQRLKEKEEKLNREKLRREMRECTFQPQINDYYRPARTESGLVATTS